MWYINGKHLLSDITQAILQTINSLFMRLGVFISTQHKPICLINRDLLLDTFSMSYLA